ncbi:OOP family OmpA-OmpF porin [Mucilaginibacter gracilis]|uniref:OOP family OmpA-OmpF porin n=1 Tax=Mucilaginibacter gracilis TaxID=423350 RepID=A0A495JB97_9SPHI|nr:OmpA family protein [Mucilaginibacter gracilis]RKR85664.1 OOP family OmpA-OmpF porin [Mucilaginibacter gracilis]
MNYSTLKKTVALSFVSLLAVGAASAQTTDSAKVAGATPKIFGGSHQYRTWSVGVNAGVTSPFVAIGGANSYKNFDLGFGYGVSLRDQLAHSFGLQLDVMGYGSNVKGNTNENPTPATGIGSFSTKINFTATISGVVNVATVDYLARKNAINFYVSAGAGMVNYTPKVYTTNDQSGTVVVNNGGQSYNQTIIPIGVGLKFRMSDRVALNLGYTGTFTDGDYFDATKAPVGTHKDKYSYAYGGLEFSLGSGSKPNLDWVNPVAIMYDELKDPTLRQEVEALKGRVTNVENAVNDLKKDSDGDGVADQFDKCPNTPAGTVVDGSGCPIKFPVIDTSKFVMKSDKPVGTAYSNIQFEFDSSVLRTSSYPILDATSADLRSSGKTVLINGYASSEGTAAHNMQLSKDRANSVKTYLVNSGVDAKHIKTKGLGETHPIADNSTEDGRVLNRRVEFKK